MTKSLLLSSLALVALSTSGCFSRLRMTPSHGRANREAFTRQIVNPNGTAKMPKGLDALEAAIVVETYRTGLSPKPRDDDDSGMILLSPHRSSIGYAAPPVAPPPAAK